MLLFSNLGIAQDAEESKASKDSKEEKVIHIGVAVPINHSRRIVDTTWARLQLAREIKVLRKDKHSPLLIDAVALDSSDREEAIDEAAKKDCDYVVTTLVVDPAVPGEVRVGPGGLQRGPQIIGNANPQQNLAVQFVLLRLGSARNLAEGTVAAPSGQSDGIDAASEAMRGVATRVAHEVRKARPPAPE